MPSMMHECEAIDTHSHTPTHTGMIKAVRCTKWVLEHPSWCMKEGEMRSRAKDVGCSGVHGESSQMHGAGSGVPAA